MPELIMLLGQSIGLVALLLSLPGSLVLARWTWGARPRPQAAELVPAPSTDTITLLVPAHDEAATLPHTLPALLSAAAADGRTRVVVIADNCRDATAQLARDAGATVLERHDEQRRGKGFALAHAIEQAPASDWYLVIDADTRLGTDYLARLRRVLATSPAGVQTRYLPTTVAEDWQAPLRHWALQGFNTLRPRARARLHEPVGILGNGFVLAASTLQQVPYQAGSIVEDLEYQLALTRAGFRMAWCEEAEVYGEMPSGEGARIQRQRWEGGRLALLRTRLPGLLRQWCQGEKSARYGLEELVLLPLSLHALLLSLGLLAPGVMALLAMAGLLVLAVHAGQALWALPPAQRWAALRVLPRYLGWKLAQLPAICRQSREGALWQRSSRQAEGSPVPTIGESS